MLKQMTPKYLSKRQMSTKNTLGQHCGNMDTWENAEKNRSGLVITSVQDTESILIIFASSLSLQYPSVLFPLSLAGSIILTGV